MKYNYTLSGIIENVYTQDQIEARLGLAYFAKVSEKGNLTLSLLSNVIRTAEFKCFREDTHFVIYKYAEHKTAVFKITQEGKDFLSISENRIQFLREIASYMSDNIAAVGSEYGLESEPTISQEIEKAIMLEKSAFKVAVES